MATVRELVTTWGFDIDEKPLKELDKKIDGMKSTLKTIGFVAAAAAGSLFGIALGTAKAGDEAYKTSQKIGVNTEALQALRYAADLAGVGQAELTTGLKFLSTRMYDANTGLKEAQRSFKDLGLTYKDQNGNLRSADEMLGSIADKFAAMPDGTKKTALAVDIFGRAGITMIPMLNQGSAAIAKLTQEARLFGLVIDEASAKSYQEFNDSITRLKGVAVGFRNEIGKQLIPVMIDMMHKIIDWIRANRELLSQKLKAFVEQLVFILNKFWKLAIFIGKTISDLVETFGGFEKVVGFLTKAFVAFMALKIIAGIGGIVVGVLGAVKAFTALGNAALFAQLKMAAIPLAIGAAIAVLYLLLDDIVGFFQGKDSLFGRAITEIQTRFPQAFGFMADLFKNIKAQFQVLVDVFSVVWGWMKRMDVAIKNFLQPMVDWLRLALEGWKRLFATVPGLMMKGFGGANSILNSGLGSTNIIQDVSGVLSAMKPAPTTSSYRNTLQGYVPGGHVEVKPTIAVTVNGGMTNEQTGGAVADAVSKLFGDMIKQTGMDFKPAIER